MLTQVKVGEGFDLDVLAHHRVVRGQLFVDEGFVGNHFAESSSMLIYRGAGCTQAAAGIEARHFIYNIYIPLR